MGKTVLPLFFSAVFHPILIILAGNNNMHESSEFENRSDSTPGCGVRCPLASEKNPHTYNWENGVATFYTPPL